MPDAIFPNPAPVVNASPLVVLARARRLELLQLLENRIIVPEAVAAEVRIHSDEAAKALISQSWLTERTRIPIPEVIGAWDLGHGESAVLAWAVANPGTVAILDDYAARTCARVLGVRVTGTLGLALLAKRKGHISLARPVVEELRRAGLYLSDGVIRAALALVGES